MSACVAGGLVRRRKILFMTEKTANLISGAMLNKLKKKRLGIGERMERRGSRRGGGRSTQEFIKLKVNKIK